MFKGNLFPSLERMTEESLMPKEQKYRQTR